MNLRSAPAALHASAVAASVGRGRAAPRAAFPQLKVVALADVGTRIVGAARWARYRKAEVDLARDIVSEIAPGTLTLLDSGLFAYDLLWGIHTRAASFLARLGGQAKPKILRELGPGDAIDDLEMHIGKLERTIKLELQEDERAALIMTIR